MRFKGVGTSPKVRGPAKLPSHPRGPFRSYVYDEIKCSLSSPLFLIRQCLSCLNGRAATDVLIAPVSPDIEQIPSFRLPGYRTNPFISSTHTTHCICIYKPIANAYVGNIALVFSSDIKNI